ncbi:hypothetical protein HDU99_009883, partial [Rhizoclosmatium hyalinum]
DCPKSATTGFQFNLLASVAAQVATISSGFVQIPSSNNCWSTSGGGINAVPCNAADTAQVFSFVWMNGFLQIKQGNNCANVAGGGYSPGGKLG